MGIATRVCRMIWMGAVAWSFCQVAWAVDGEHQEFALGDFALETGVTLPQAKLVYVTYGTLNASKSNAVLLPSWYSGDHHGYDFLIGPGKALDPSRYFIIATDQFSNGLSSSPSNTAPPFAGPDFPQIAIRDNVAATHQLVTELFEIERLVAVVGFSMGAQQALQWAVSHPGMMSAVVAYCGNAKEYPFGIARLEGAKAAITADAGWNNGYYETPPEVGLKALARHWAAWGSSQEWWRQELFRRSGAESVEEWIENSEQNWLSGDANDLLAQATTWQTHNVGDTGQFSGDLEAALRSIKASVLMMPSETDLYFPPEDSIYESQFISDVELIQIPTVWGHSAGLGINPEDVTFLNDVIRRFLAER
ncbi:MAG: alpha/beta fold hydrolase [Acidobacteriota bacterium]|nr:alpha/beta fold hydrolase [Acidobacteriota bacterium]